MREVVNAGVREGFDYYNRETAANDARIRQKCIDSGNTIIPRDQIDVEAFKAIIAEKVIPKLTAEGKVAGGGWDYIQSLK